MNDGLNLGDKSSQGVILTRYHITSVAIACVVALQVGTRVATHRVTFEFTAYGLLTVVAWLFAAAVWAWFRVNPKRPILEEVVTPINEVEDGKAVVVKGTVVPLDGEATGHGIERQSAVWAGRYKGGLAEETLISHWFLIDDGSGEMALVNPLRADHVARPHRSSENRADHGFFDQAELVGETLLVRGVARSSNRGGRTAIYRSSRQGQPVFDSTQTWVEIVAPSMADLDAEREAWLPKTPILGALVVTSLGVLLDLYSSFFR